MANFMYNKLANKFHKDIAASMGKARESDFTIAVIGRLPKVFADTYLLKAKV